MSVHLRLHLTRLLGVLAAISCLALFSIRGERHLEVRYRRPGAPAWRIGRTTRPSS